MNPLKNIIRTGILSAAVFACAAFAPASKKFPELKGTTLNGKSVVIPKQLEGKFAVLGIAYSIKAQDDLNTWYQPVYTEVMESKFYPANVYFIPMTGNIKGMSQEKIKSRLKESMDSEWHKYVLFYPENPDNYISSLEMSEKDKPYIFVLNPKGEIVYSTSGAYTEAKMGAITDKLSE